VTWNDAVQFCQWLCKREGRNYRLPTEAEWEYACRAGTTTPFGCGPSLTSGQANFNGEMPFFPVGSAAREKAAAGGAATAGVFREKPVAVGSYAANDFGLHDMHGNVAEWCLDWYASYETNPLFDPQVISNHSQLKIVRGGSWYSPGFACRSAYRRQELPGQALNTLGFRVVLVPAE
jgi:formylglycine-generating enzyme required for sulfatase activity